MPTTATTSIVQHDGKTLLEIRLVIELAMPGQQAITVVASSQEQQPLPSVDAISFSQESAEKPAEQQPESRTEIVVENTGLTLAKRYDDLLRERDIERRVSAKTVRDNKGMLMRFQNWMQERHQGESFDPLQAMLEPHILRHYAEYLRAQEKGNSSSMCSKALSTIGKLSAACVKARLIPFRPEAPTKSSVNMIRPRTEQQRRVKAVPVTLDELAAMLAVVDGAKWPRLGKVKPSHFWKTNLVAHYVYGFRSQDWIACRTTDKQGLLWTGVVDRPECPVVEGLMNDPGWVYYLVHKTSKKDEAAERPSDVLAPLSVEMREMLEEFRGIDDLRVFPMSYNSATYSREFQALLKRAGLSDKERKAVDKPIIRLSLGQRNVASFRKGASAMWAKYAGRPAASYMLHHAVAEENVAKMTAESYLQNETVLWEIVAQMPNLPVWKLCSA
jgi:hypothetical protein